MPTVIISKIRPTGGDYATPALWASATQGNLVADDEQHIGEVLAGTYAGFVLSGSTTDATRNRILRAEQGSEHGAIRGVVGVRFTSELEINEDFAEVSTAVFPSTGNLKVSGGTSVKVEDCVFYDKSSGTAMESSGASGSVTYVGCIVMSANKAFDSTSTMTTVLSQCTFLNTTGGGDAVDGGSEVSVHNSTSMGSAGNDFGTSYNAASDYNASSDSTAPGGNSLGSRTIGNEVKDATPGSEDPHLLETGTLRAAGNTGEPGFALTDFEGQVRDLATPSMGAHEQIYDVLPTVSFVGATGLYLTLLLWDAATDGDLVTGQIIEEAQCQNQNVSGGFGTVFDGAITSKKYFRRITFAPGAFHGGAENAGARFDTLSQISRYREDWFQVVGMAYRQTGVSAESGAVGQIFKDCYVYHLLGSGNAYSNTSAVNPTFINCVAQESTRGWRDLGGPLTCINCTSLNNSRGYALTDAGTVNTNCIGVNNGFKDWEFATLGSNNLSSDATAPGANSVINQVPTDVLVSVATGAVDYRVKAGSAAINAGTGTVQSLKVIDPPKRPFIDFEGNLRDGLFDIGVSEAAPPPPPTVITETIGSTAADYLTANLWEAVTDINLIVANEIRIGQLQNQEHDQGGGVFNPFGGTADVDHYRELTVVAGAEQTGTLGVGARITNHLRIEIQEEFFRANKFESNGGQVWAKANNVTIEKVLSASVGLNHFTMTASFSNITIKNCIGVGAAEGIVVQGTGGTNNVVYNNTISTSTGNGIWNQGGVTGLTVENNIVDAAQDCLKGTGAGTWDYNLVNDATAIGGNSLSNQTMSDVFVCSAVGIEDLRLIFGSPAEDVGLDLTAFGVTEDTVGVSRPVGGAFDMGAFEGVVTLPSPTVNTTLVGATGLYLTPAIWEAATDNDLKCLNQVEIGQLQKQTHDGSAGAIAFSGANTDSARNRTLEVAVGAEHDGTTPGTGAIVTNYVEFKSNEKYFTLRGMELQGVIAILNEDNNTAEKTLCSGGGAISSGGAWTGITVRNNSIIQPVIGITISVTVQAEVYQNTIANASSIGIFSSSGNANITVKNNNVFGSATADLSGTGSGVWDRNITSDATATGTFSQPSVSAATVVVNPGVGTEDLRLLLSSPALNTGEDLTSVGITDDIVGTARPISTAYDLGSFEDFFTPPEVPFPEDYVLQGVAIEPNIIQDSRIALEAIRGTGTIPPLTIIQESEI